MASSSVRNQSVSDMFDKGLDMFDKLSNEQQSYEVTNSGDTQSHILKTIELLEETTKIISIVGMFSTNESIEEVATNDIKFFLLPALLGMLTLKLSVSSRSEIISASEIYFRDFLNRCTNYKIIDFYSPSPTSELSQNMKENIELTLIKRNAKIQQYKESKELEQNLAVLRSSLKNSPADDEVKREFFFCLVKSYARAAIQELASIDAERPLLEHLAKMRTNDNLKMEKYPISKPLRPIIITKDEIQKKIYGAGYPSLPTMSVQEFYEKRAASGEFPDPDKEQKAPELPSWMTEQLKAQHQNQLEKELDKLEEIDDADLLLQKRSMDEFKDTHRHGYGNRMNRS